MAVTNVVEAKVKHLILSGDFDHTTISSVGFGTQMGRQLSKDAMFQGLKYQHRAYGDHYLSRNSASYDRRNMEVLHPDHAEMHQTDAPGNTRPIDVPRIKHDKKDDWPHEIDIEPGYSRELVAHSLPGHNEPGLQDFLHNRRPSMSFNTESLLDSSTRPRNDSSAAHPSPPLDPVRSQSPIHFEQAMSRGASQTRHTEHQSGIAQALSQATKSPLTIGRNKDPTLASVSPLLIGRDTPQRDADTSSEVEEAELISSALKAELFAHPTSLKDSGPWPRPRRNNTFSSTGNSFERSHSLRHSRRHLSRHSTLSSQSPATAFLSRFAREEQACEPDGEGQVIGEYVLGKEVGYGGFSVVKEAYTIEGDDRICRAVKIVRKLIPGKNEGENERLQAEFEHEMSLWRCLGHRHILPLIEVFDNDFATFCFTKLNTGGTLFDKVRANRNGLGRDLTRRYLYQLGSALRYLHEDVRVVHRDVKLENCLVDLSDPVTAEHGGNILLCDFGLADFMSRGDEEGAGPATEWREHGGHFSTRSTSSYAVTDAMVDPLDSIADAVTKATAQDGVEAGVGASRREARTAGGVADSRIDAGSISGSLQYASPESILSPDDFLAPVIDIWAFGIVGYALAVGDLPFQHVFQPRVQMMILAGEWNREALETKVLDACWRQGSSEDGVSSEDATNGPGAEEIEERERLVEFVQGCLDMDSSKRWTIAQVLASRWLEGVEEMVEGEGAGWGVQL